jgi:hypothetical protein
VEGQNTRATSFLRQGRDREARELLHKTVRTAREIGINRSVFPLLYGIIKLREGDRAKGLAWIGFTRKHSASPLEPPMLMGYFADLIRGNQTEEEVEAGLRAGEGLKLEEILEEAGR